MPDGLKDGRFVIVGSLGEGAQGHTFDGVDKREGRAVAIKRFDVRTAKTWKDAELAERETRVLQSLSHPRLPKYRDHFEQDGALYLVMDKIDGESLASLQKRGAVLSEEDVARLLHDASEVLDYLHGRAPPVIHRDLKPGNVIRRPDGSFAFVDFGAVREKLRPGGGSTVIGTFGYMAPEQFQGRALPASDVYAVGATALSMLTGCQPEDLPHKGLAIDVRASLAGRGRGRFAAALGTVLTQMLDPDPDQRASRIGPLLGPLDAVGASHRSRPAPSPPPPSHATTLGDDLSSRFAQFVRQAEAFDERARDYERRAEDGGPGADGWLRGAEGWRKGARKWRAEAERHALELAREADRHARRRARQEIRRANRAARRQGRASGANHRPPWPATMTIALLWTIGIVAVTFVMQRVVPAVLRFLSFFFASRALNGASNAVRTAGHAAVEEMNRSRQWFLEATTARRVEDASGLQASGGPPAPARARVAGEPATNVRIEAGDVADDEADSRDPDEARR